MENAFDEEKRKLAKTLKAIRKNRTLSQKDLSEMTGITQADISKIERGLANPSISTLSRIANATGAELNIDFIVDGSNVSLEIETFSSAGNDIKSMCATTSKLLALLCDDFVEKAILYGSCARGEQTEESDVDIALLTSCNRLESKKYQGRLSNVAALLMDKYEMVVNFVCLPKDEFEEKKSWYRYFKNIDEDGIVFYAR